MEASGRHFRASHYSYLAIVIFHVFYHGPIWLIGTQTADGGQALISYLAAIPVIETT